ncbi:MAG: alkaline phosphatase family protein [Candidatus Bathyarchaeota archaeon]|nr:alkaline phosphatase family protein [Candidatus Bathyarchaeota archaeon]
MRVTIIGIDGLDHGIIEELDLRNLKQRLHGRLTIPDECYRGLASGDRSPWTPLCWMTILTGTLPPEEYRQTRARSYKNPIVEGLKRRFGGALGFIRGKREFLQKIGISQARMGGLLSRGAVSRSMSTIFDLTEKSIDFNVPTYSDAFSLKPLHGAREEKELLRFVDEEHELMERFVFSVMGRGAEYDLLMAYTRILDHYGHQMYRTEAFYHRYRMMDLFIHELASKVEGLLLIVSDHGFTELEDTTYGGRHSDHASYSMNLPMDTPMNSLLDVYPLVRRALEV